MQHFIFLFWLILALLPLCFFIYRAYAFKKNMIYKSITEVLINNPVFSTVVVRQLASYIFKQSPVMKKRLLQDIFHRKNSFIKNINNESLSQQVILICSKNSRPKKNASPFISLLYIQKLLQQNLYDKASRLLEKINDRPRSKFLAALKLLSDAKINFHNGDLLNSSAWCIQAAKLFKQKKLLYEEAQAYFLLGQIYFSGNFFDSAELILRDALKLFQAIKCQRYTAQCLCLLGSLTASQERWDEAKYFFDNALKQSSKLDENRLYYLHLCHTALLDVALNNPHTAISKISQIKYTKNDFELQALCNHVLAHAHLCLKHRHKACRFAKEAHKMYSAANDFSSALEIISITAINDNHNIS